ncbi:MAG: DivIVA domain-containing protein [Clostridia bacterium]|nr:DivIVA domain-containing protein [Clostridia bacterium]
MLSPHELKNHSFTKSMRGYTTVEVDEYIDFLIEKYTELYRENDELERKLKSTVTKLEEIKNDEDSIRSALIDAKRAAAKIKSDAEERAEAIIRSAKSSCNAILSDFNTKIEEGRDTLAAIQNDTYALKRELFDRYSEHIRYLDRLTDGIEEAEIPDTDALRREAVNSLKSSIAAAYQAAPAQPEPEEAPSEAAPAADASAAEVSAADISAIENPAIEPEELDEIIDAEPQGIETTEDATQMFNSIPTEDENVEDIALQIDREPLIAAPARSKGGLKDSIQELNRQYKEAEEVINTPDSDLGDDASYLDFVKSVTGKIDEKEKEKAASKSADFDMLFSNEPKKKK